MDVLLASPLDDGSFSDRVDDLTLCPFYSSLSLSDTYSLLTPEYNEYPTFPPEKIFPLGDLSVTSRELEENCMFMETPPAAVKRTTRHEWSESEDKIFLQGLQTNGLDFKATAKLLPGRTILQIRKHYNYLAKAIRANREVETYGFSKTPVRRIKVRGRARRGRDPPPPSPLLMDLKDCIIRLESTKAGKRKSGRPKKEKTDTPVIFA
eukprot:TRINITY_DN1060_c0_g1_i1.p1 TRINITY_DN1060_c0_g1~~TRINITY_DN1060_c0_g1_i1.p1  ORF type:complete len:225 (+),score=39.63 TRINITY_DN1060_c0_g1_i1:54-677(+)